ncbi:hypothetical protein [Nesterenkonia halotolerans]|uniref:Multisubunit Na+/H+ antiporter MnhG subunit n=1 Tax=Nesterenkonia halotolerans TaxID=225325 RepID=A0ABR9J8T6_9MICC|nr:hypothetical protein [Nesterenkonia halotolerans]MBE1514991.1 multisubunit Na+/H+ antiporter MnhG subunit [Nesterenkonia halotolerans]
MSMMWTGLVVNLLIFAGFLVVITFVLHAIIRAAVRNGMRDHQEYLEKRTQETPPGGPGVDGST